MAAIAQEILSNARSNSPRAFSITWFNWACISYHTHYFMLDINTRMAYMS